MYTGSEEGRQLTRLLFAAGMKDPTLLMVHQNSLRFYQKVAYDTRYAGLALALDEGKRLGEVLGRYKRQGYCRRERRLWGEILALGG